jgi:NAD(P)H-dependent flavin oxidoreductase YrpB (nitropropane dioxygenase family)
LVGELGVVSGVALDTVMVRRLQRGDPGGHVRRALGAFPSSDVAQRIIRRYFVEGGLGPTERFRLVPRLSLKPDQLAVELLVAANFAEVFLAKEGHDGLVGVNYLEKIQMATPASLYGAMLAGVDYVLVGAGIPAELPALLNSLAAGDVGKISVDVHGAGSTGHSIGVDPSLVVPGLGSLSRPRLLAIVASHVLASFLARDERTRPDGFVVEGPCAGGHNAPPRGPLVLDEDGQPLYGKRDVVDLDVMASLGLPYWLAGGYARPDSLVAALSAGATGIQVGSGFALCEESGFDPSVKSALIAGALSGTLRVRTDAAASPTGFPFKVADLPGTVADADLYARRRRICEAGYLRVPYLDEKGEIGYRCAAEPCAAYVRKGGNPNDTLGRRCVCSGLIAAIGLGQRNGTEDTEPWLVTIGDDLSFLPDMLTGGRESYTAADMVEYLLGAFDSPSF